MNLKECKQNRDNGVTDLRREALLFRPGVFLLFFFAGEQRFIKQIIYFKFLLFSTVTLTQQDKLFHLA